MKAPAFDHVRASSLPEALALLALHGTEARLLAGGQSLLPALNLRLSSPAILIDIGGLQALRGVALVDGVLRIGALTTHAALARDALVATHAPLFARAVPHIAHPAIRNRGTIGGSLANADPAAELPACAVALDAVMVVAGPAGERRVAAAEFFLGVFATALGQDEILVAVEVPPATGPCFFAEYARRSGDYALAGLAAQRCGAAVRMAFFGIGDAPEPAAAAALVFPDIAAAEAALVAAVAPREDIQASAGTRRQLARVLLRRAFQELAA